jgi:hypothetical protein
MECKTEKPKIFAPKILIAIPTYEGKNYCLDAFLDNVQKIDYPASRLKIVIADNSLSNENAKYINKKYGIQVLWRDYSGYSVFAKMADSHNALRKFFLEETDCEYMLHLESDIFPPSNVLWELLWCRKPIVNALYNIFDASHRTPCIHLQDKKHEHWRSYSFAYGIENFWHWFIKGKLQPTYIAGIGCCLLHRKIMEKFNFRHNAAEPIPPDTWFAKDLQEAGVQNYVHTGVICFHHNREEWGRHFEYVQYLKSE